MLKSFSLTGKFNVGKTFIIELLSDIFIKNDEDIQVHGIKLYKVNDILFLEAAGESGTVKDEPNYILERRIIDHFFEDVLLETSMLCIHVVNRLDNTD